MRWAGRVPRPSAQEANLYQVPTTHWGSIRSWKPQRAEKTLPFLWYLRVPVQGDKMLIKELTPKRPAEKCMCGPGPGLGPAQRSEVGEGSLRRWCSRQSRRGEGYFGCARRETFQPEAIARAKAKGDSKGRCGSSRRERADGGRGRGQTAHS